MKKKILIALLSLSLLSLAAGCSAYTKEPENGTMAGEETEEPEPDRDEGEEAEEPEQKEEPSAEPEETIEEEAAGAPEDEQGESASRIPLENGQADENSTAVMFYKFKKDYGNDGAEPLGTLEFNIPQLTARSMEAGKINEDILEYFEERLDDMDEMVKGLSEWENTEEEDSDLSAEYTLEINYELTYLNENKICLLLTGYEYSSGAVHGQPFRKSLIYNLENGERMEAKDLFDVTKEEFSAAFISAFEEHIAKSPGDYWADAMDYVREGASLENEDFYLTDSGTVFYYDPYTLAAYAYGFIEVEIPYDSIGLK